MTLTAHRGPTQATTPETNVSLSLMNADKVQINCKDVSNCLLTLRVAKVTNVTKLVTEIQRPYGAI